MQYVGDVYRPPSEAHSLLIQVTLGCSWNRCRFCDMYPNKPFAMRKTADVIADLEECTYLGRRVRRIFLCDGDALVVKTDMLLEILAAARRLFPALEGVRSYASARNVNGKSVEELAALRDAGLDMVYIGLESGSDAVLTDMHKGETRADMEKAATRLHEAGIEQSISIIAGLGGKQHWREHAQATAEALNAMQPEYVGLLVLYPGSDGRPYSPTADPDIKTPPDRQVLQEMQVLLEGLELENCLFSTAHVSNRVHLRGMLPADKPAMVAAVKHLLGQANGVH